MGKLLRPVRLKLPTRPGLGAYLRNLNVYFCTQAYAADYSSGSVSLLKWFNQTTQVAQSDYSSGSISEYSRLRNPVQPYP